MADLVRRLVTIGLGPSATQRNLAYELYRMVKGLPLICPHGHVEPKIFVDSDYSFGDPVELFIRPDHYLRRMLYSQGVRYEELGMKPLIDTGVPVETDPRKIWKTFVSRIRAFHLTPTGVWFSMALCNVFGIEEELCENNADKVYDMLCEKLASPEFSPRALFRRFNIKVLSTTDAATSSLSDHAAIRASEWNGRVIPTFRPDGVINDCHKKPWRDNIRALGEVTGIEIDSYAAYLGALRIQRQRFGEMGCVATDHGVTTLNTGGRLSLDAAEKLFLRAINRNTGPMDSELFTAHMLMVMAEMSQVDGMTMQLHLGCFRNHNDQVFTSFGPDQGFDLPIGMELIRSLKALLNEFGNDPNMRIVLFTLDDTLYARELAPLSAYPAVKIGPPWWFHDSPNGIEKFLNGIIETAGIYNFGGFNDDTRSFTSIPVRHEMWRRCCANWVAGMILKGMISPEDGEAVLLDLVTRNAYGL